MDSVQGARSATGYNLEIQLRRKPSEDELRVAWDQIGDELVAGMAAGHRPYGWWRFEAPSLRRLRPGMPNLEHPANTQYSWGLPQWITEWRDGWEDFYESEPAFLAREGLLTEAAKGGHR